MSHAGHACPKKAAGTTRPPSTHSLRHPSRPGVWLLPADASDLITTPTASCKGRHELSLDTSLTAAPASSHPPRGGRAAGQYAYSFSPQRPAAKPVPRGQAQLWGVIATHTQRHGTQHHSTRTQLDAHSPNATLHDQATQRSRKPRNTDATGRNTGTPRNSSAGRGYEMALVNSVTRGTTAMGKRETGLRSTPSPLGTVDNSASD